MPRLYVAGVVLAVACRIATPPVPHPLTNQFRYTCCNLHYEAPEISDANYLRGTAIPLGTRVQILEVDKDRVKFAAPGHPTITLVVEHAGRTLTMDQYLDRLFVVDDPYGRLPKLPPDPKEAVTVDRRRRMIEDGTVEVGMSRAEVLMAIGYPPADRTPSLDAPTWTYWASPRDPFRVHFEGDAVSRVTRRARPGRRRRGIRGAAADPPSVGADPSIVARRG